MQETAILSVVTGLLLIPAACKKPPPRPAKVNFHYETLVRIGNPGDNWSGPFRGIKMLKSPEGAQANQLLLARVKSYEFEKRDCWEYFSSWKGEEPSWTEDLNSRGIVHEFPERNESGEYFGWYSWLPSVVWNEGLGLYIMVNGGTYAGHGLSDAREDYYDSWMHTKSGSLGFWYAENPYGPWNQFFYTDYWIVDDEKNRTCQSKLSPKWICEKGTRMVLIWSDAMKNEEGRSHTVNYRWNQMEISLELD